MLADILEASREQLVDELERRAALTESTALPVAGRRARLKALVQEAIGALRSEGAGETAQPLSALPSFIDLALEFRERELVQRYLIDEIKHKHLQASCEETVTVAAWANQAERTRLRDQNERLETLLDNVHEAALILAPDGKILYCNVLAAKRIRDVAGVSRDGIIGKTPTDLGIPSELVVGRHIDEMVQLARGHESFEMTAWGRAKEGAFDEWDPKNVSPLVCYLASAACQFNGETFFVQGGTVRRVKSWEMAETVEQQDTWTVAALGEALAKALPT